MPKIDFSSLEKRWPSAFVARGDFPKFTGGLYSPKYVSNLDARGLGPEGRVRVGRKILYPVRSVIKWLEARASLVG